MNEQDPAMERMTAETQRLAEQLFGPGACRTGGVIHVCSTVRTHDGRLRVIVIGPHAPRSELDFLALSLCRARADAILTTAQNLRGEPQLVHDPRGTHGTALSLLRKHMLGKRGPPRVAILTRSGDLPLDHPVWSDGTSKVVLAPPDMAKPLSTRLEARADIVGLEDLDARKAIAWLQEQGAHTISIEAGPSTVGQLYESPRAIDELLLARCETSELAPEALGGALPDDARLFAGLSCLHESVRDEPSGRWIFQRWSRT